MSLRIVIRHKQRTNGSRPVHSTRAMVCFYIPAHVGIEIPPDAFPAGSNVLQASQRHITLKYLGDVSQSPPGLDRAVLSKLLEDFAYLSDPVTVRLTGVDKFSKVEDGTKDAIYARVDSLDITEFRDAMVRFLDVPVEDEHDFLPHVTLAYVPAGSEVDLESIKVQDDPITFDSVQLTWQEEVQSYDMGGRPVLKQLPIDDESKEALLQIRINLFFDQSDELARQVYEGEITIGEWEEQMRQAIRQLYASAAAIGKGGWDLMTPADWGRLGPILKDQYQYLHGFAQYISDNRDTISLDYIRARARLYGEGAGYASNVTWAGTLERLLPWIPRDGSTECLNRCHCQWNLSIVGSDGDWNLVRAVWQLNPADHCNTCVERDGHTVNIRVHNSIDVPPVIGGL